MIHNRLHRINKYLDKALYMSFLLIMVDCVLTGYGHWIMIGPLTPRILLWGFCVLGSTYLIIYEKGVSFLKRNPLLSVFVFGSFLLFQAYRGYVLGNSFSVLVDDIRAYSWIALAPTACIVLDSNERVNGLMKAIIISSYILVLLVLLSLVSSICFENWGNIIINFVINYGIFSISRISETIIRFSTGNSLYIVPSIVYCFYEAIVSKKQFLLPVLMGSFGLVAIFFSYTRSYYLGTSISLFLALVVFLRIFGTKKRKIIGTLFLILFMTTMILLVFSVVFDTNYIQFAITRTFPNTNLFTYHSDSVKDYIELTVSSDMLRSNTINEVLELGQRNLIFGNGLGSGIESRNFKTEYFYLELIQKLGIIGFVLFLIPVMLMMIKIGQNFMHREYSLEIVFYLGFVSFLVSSIFNPLLNSSIGLCYYCVCVGLIQNS